MKPSVEGKLRRRILVFMRTNQNIATRPSFAPIFQRAGKTNALGPEFVTEVNSEQTLDAMIAAGRYDWTNAAITAARFPTETAGVRRFSMKLFQLGHAVSSEEAIAALRKQRFAPATHAQGLAFGAMFPSEQQGGPIACLGFSVQMIGVRYVVCLVGDRVMRRLGLYDWLGAWNDEWRFLGVREIGRR
jgi:hypothetical protein